MVCLRNTNALIH